MNVSALVAFLGFAMSTDNAVASADPHSYAEPAKVRVTTLNLDLTVSFPKHRLSGSAELSLDWLDKAARKLTLDTRDLVIEKIEAANDAGKLERVEFTLAPRDATLGSALHITLKQQSPKVRIAYHTVPEASGLQWLDPQQTAGKKSPFMYSQSEAIHARSWVPLQDTPAVRFTYTARIRVPKALRAAMSADNDPKHPLNGDFQFAMPQRIPSYLLALAVGDLAVKEIGPRSAIYAEPGTVEAAAKEFEDTEKMIRTAEQLYGPYRWGRYDLLVLPPSFPFGGMENPRLTFATPTVIAGDKSLVSLVAHELAHSWSGNLVTNASWQNIWLNEGFTTYVQGRIVEAIYGKEQADEEFIIAVEELKKELKDIPEPDQRLLPDLNGRDADDGLSDIPYTKGSWFLQLLEQRFGRNVFDSFLREYFDHFAFQSITTQQFVDYLKANLLDKQPGKMDLAEVESWIHQGGIPSNAPLPESARFKKIDANRRAWLAGDLSAPALNDQRWTTQEWQYFLDSLPDVLNQEQMAALDQAFHLTGTKNAEIAFRWYRLSVRSDYKAAYAAMQAHMLKIGRRILVVPLYEALAKTAQGKALALAIYKKARPGYHPMTQGSVDKALDLKAPASH